MGYCRCHEWLKRGGDDCSYVFCLNDCSGRGTCLNGVCTCNANYFGEDCSALIVNVLSGTLLKIWILGIVCLFLMLNLI